MTEHLNDLDTNTQADLQQAALPEASASTLPVKERKKNALVHGIDAEDLILEWESEDDFIKLRDGIWLDRIPRDAWKMKL